MFLPITLLLIVLGIYFRLDQFFIQVLIGDEWHAIHKIQKSTPSEIINSFGSADYSIPLTLLYWYVATAFGLSETLMRIPMIICGVSTLVLFSLFVYKKFSNIEALIFSFLLSFSSLLIVYSQKARPYAITLFLVYVAIWCFYKFIDSDKKLLFAFAYSCVAALAIWLHLIVFFFVFSPFIFEMIKLPFQPKGQKLKLFLKLLSIAVPALLLTSVLIVPPLINDLASLTLKTGKNLPTLETFYGFLFLMFGTKSNVIVVLLSVLALIGLPRLFSLSTISINIVMGFLLTLLIILTIQPAWTNHPGTLLRYVLPILPLSLMAVACGFYSIMSKIHSDKMQSSSFLFSIIVLTPLFYFYIYSSPLRILTASPNSYINHGQLIFEFRDEKNEIKEYMEQRTLSPYWQSFNKSPQQYKIAVAPWYFESYSWDAVRWEQVSKQIIVPGYLTGLCVDNRPGEVINNNHFNFKNVAFLGDQIDLKNKKIDYIVYQKPERLFFKNLYVNLDTCIDGLYKIYDQPIYEDKLILVFKNLSGE